MSLSIERKLAERRETEPDEFASVWSGSTSNEPLPGDPNGHLRLAFRLAEVIGDLSADENSSEDITELNQYFSEFRNAAASEVQTCRERLGTKLEAIAEQHPELVSRIADFQSQLDEQIRRAADDDSFSSNLDH